MGRIGPAELLGLLAVVVIIAIPLLIFRGSSLRSRLARRIERAAFREVACDHENGSQETYSTGCFPFPRALAASAALGALLVTLSFHDPLNGVSHESLFSLRDANDLSFVFGGMFFALLAISWFALIRVALLHFRPGHDRHRKYEWLLIFSSCSTLAYLPLNIVAIGLLSPAPLMLLLGGFQHIFPATYIDKFANPPSWLFWIVRNWTVLALFVFPIYPINLIWIWIRYFIVEKASQRPILYFRSFRDSDVPTAFGRIVAKAAQPFGVVLAIVHENQPGSSLTRYTGVAEQPREVVVSDAAWHEWVAERLRNASAIVVDATVQTEGIAWEIQAVQSSDCAHRAIVLLEEGSASVVPKKFATLRYALDRNSVRRAKAELRLWLQNVVTEDMRSSDASVHSHS
jgi:hypothetical protein